MGIIEILLLLSMFAVVGAVEAIIRHKRKQRETKEMIEDFERRHPGDKKDEQR